MECSNSKQVLLSTTGSIPNHRIISCMGVINATWAKTTSTRSGVMEFIDTLRGKWSADTYITYTEENCYELVTKRIKEMAFNKNCNAVIGVRYVSHFSENVLRVTAYGTACVIE